LAAITNRVRLRFKLPRARALARLAMVVVQAAAVFELAQHKLWPGAVLVVLAGELWGLRPGGPVAAGARGRYLVERTLPVLMGLSAALIVATMLRLASQVVVAVLYALWRLWWNPERDLNDKGLLNLLVVQAAVFEAIFLIAAMPTWHLPSWLVLGVVWAACYGSVLAVLVRRGERAAGVMAATWSLVAVEISWVLLLWLFTYTTTGGYLLVPQPALILTGLGYCFGSIYASQRQGSLSRGRLTEYLLVGLILIAIVVTGTSWRGTL
jgi:hypothetical protein